MADPAYRPGLVWGGDSLVWGSRTLSWANVLEAPDILGETMTVMADRGRDLTVAEDRGRNLTVTGGRRR